MPAQTVIKLRRDTAANWTSTNPVLAAGEAGFESDTKKLKIGDGTTAWSSLTYTGADVTNLDYIGFDEAAAHTPTTGEVAWDADAETLAVGLDGVVTARIGQDLFIRVKNASGSVAIPVGTVVQFAGATGDTVTAEAAVTDGSVDHNYMIGITAEQIAADGFGFVMLNGVVGGLNTAAWAPGTILYADPSTAGNLTATEPSAPNLKLPIAAVVKQGSGSSGKLLVRMHVGENLGDIHNVQITSATAGEVLQWDGTKWVNSAVAISEVTGLSTALDGKAAASHTHGMSDLTAFEITDPATGQTLQYNGTKWVNAAAAGGGETISSFLLMGA